MRTHRRTAATIIAALAITISGPAAALAVPADTAYPRPVPQTNASTPSDPTVPAVIVGDTKFDSPGASRAPLYDEPKTVQVVQPQRTIVRDTDPLLPIALSGAALLVALGLAGTQLVRSRSLHLG